MGLSDKSPTANGLSLPRGGGAQHGIGETFTPDLHTGTANATVPIVIPPGRNGVQPELVLRYSSGAGNGAFGLGWSLATRAVTRKTASGVPLYDDARDRFLLSGVEDLVPVSGAPAGAQRYRPRTEGRFALVDHLTSGTDHWEVRSPDGSVNVYGTPRPSGAPTTWADPAALPSPTGRIFSWHLSETRDSFRNRIAYGYRRDGGRDGPHACDQLYLSEVAYADYGPEGAEEFLVTVRLVYDDEPDPLDGSAQPERPDPFSDYRSGFEIRTRRRCTWIVVASHAGAARRIRAYHLVYLDQLPANGVSLLHRVEAVGFDDDDAPVRELPPLELGYTTLDLRERRFMPLVGEGLPSISLADPSVELVDLTGDGLPDLFEANGAMRRWGNLGDGRFDLPRGLAAAPGGARLADPGVQLLDANGDGRPDLLVATESAAGYFPVTPDGAFARDGFHPYALVPSFRLEDPEVRLVDLDGDGITDAVRSGTRLECFFNDAELGWTARAVRQVERKSLEQFPNVDFADPRVRLADMTGDGLHDVVLIYDGNVEYWPSLGRGDFGERVHTRHGPRFPSGYDPRRVLLGDVDGDGAADIVYVDDGRIVVWINQSGNSWGPPAEVTGTPPVSDVDSVRLADVLGVGVTGVLWSSEPRGQPPQTMFFLDLTGGRKPYLLEVIDNSVGSTTRVSYAPSTRFYLEDQRHRRTRWRSTLPFPVHVVERMETLDHVSGGKLTSRFSYHHGYWDGFEREFRGFGRVDQLDSEEFALYNAPGLHGDEAFAAVDGERARHFSPPTLTKTWFHQGPVAAADGTWRESDFRSEFWPGDRQLLERPATTEQLLASLPRSGRRDALRALRGSVLRTELYALDGSSREAAPYTVTEKLLALREEDQPTPPAHARPRIFFPYVAGERTTQWERGLDPLTQIEFIDDHDDFGQPRQRTKVALPRRSAIRRTGGAAAGGDETDVLALHTRTEFAEPDAGLHLRNRVAHERTLGLAAPPGVTETDADDVAQVLHDGALVAAAVHERFRTLLDPWSAGDPLPAAVELLGHVVTYYDGSPARAFLGRNPGYVGPYGAAVRTESLAFTSERLDDAWGTARPTYVGGAGTIPAGAPAGFGTNLGYELRQRSSSGYHDGYYARLDRQKLDFHDPASTEKRGRVLAVRDALGNDFSFSHDQFGLLRTGFTDPAGLTATATNDYRAFQPSLVTDPNGNRTVFTYSPSGLLATVALQGKPGAGEGDSARPGTEYSYDFSAPPVAVRTRRYVHHDSEPGLSPQALAEVEEQVEYADGLGRLIQTRVVADDVLFDEIGEDALFGDSGLPPDPTVPVGDAVGRRRAWNARPNVIVSGWKTFDNKGRVVEVHEPFFSKGLEYAAASDEQLGAKTTLEYDPRGNAIRRIHPDGCEHRGVFGVPSDLADPDGAEPSAWELTIYDPNDNAGRTHAGDPGVAAYEHHWNTPTTFSVDGLGRTLSALARTRSPGNPAGPLRGLRTFATFDLNGNLLSLTDPLGRTALERVYDLLGRELRVTTVDGGTRLSLPDALGNVVEHLSPRGGVVLRRYDALNRLRELWASDDATTALGLRESFEYGDAGTATQPPAARGAARSANRLGRLYRSHDQAGMVTVPSYDFKGNPLGKARQAIADSELLAGFGPPSPPGWKVPAYRMDWNAGAPALDAEVREVTYGYDALDRVKSLRYPLDLDAQGDLTARKTLRLSRDKAGLLTGVTLDGTTFVERIAYSPAGKRLLLVYAGRTLMTRYAYDPATTRLARLRTEECTAASGGLTLSPGGTVFQDLGYGFDLAGNVVALAERSPAAGVAGGATLDRAFSYDPLYRLSSATGRESTTPAVGWPANLRDLDPAATRPYTESYAYDDTGNLTSLRHEPLATGYSRTLTLVPGSNRLDSESEAGSTRAYSYDASGNLVKEDVGRHLEWDYADRLSVFRAQQGTAAPLSHARHLYDSSGRLVKKLVWRGAGRFETSLYIEGVFERHARTDPAGVSEHDLLHVLDDRKRIGVVRVGPDFDGSTAAPVLLYLSDHLESTNELVEPNGTLVCREEYLPYGETSLGGVERNSYRFTGRERHEDSGLSYHGNRWYAPWLGRWTSCDPLPPAKPGDGANQYAYVRGNPLSSVDPGGLQDEPLPEGVIPVDGTPIARDPEPEFPKWFTADQRKAYKDRWRVVGAFRSWANRDPDTGRPKPPRDPYTKYEHRVFAIGEFCRQAIIFVVTLPAFWEWTIFEAVPEAEIQAQLITELKAMPIKPSVEHYFVGNVPSPELAQMIEGFQAQGIPLRGNFVHVDPSSSFYANVVNHGGAYHEQAGAWAGTTFVNMRVLGNGVADAELGTFLTTPQVLQHEMGHFGQGVIQVAPETILGNALYRQREAAASMCAARVATNTVDSAALLAHAQANINAAQQTLTIPP